MKQTTIIYDNGKKEIIKELVTLITGNGIIIIKYHTDAYSYRVYKERMIPLIKVKEILYE
jgi:hypothetical protein